MSVNDPVLTSTTLTVSVLRAGGTFGVVEVQWNASVSGKSRFCFNVTFLFATVEYDMLPYNCADPQ